MSDVAQATSGQPPSLPELIMEVPEPVWLKIAEALKVETRAQAAELVKTNEQAAAAVSKIITASMGQSGLTAENQGAPAESALTAPPPAPAPMEERMYGKGKAKLKIA